MVMMKKIFILMGVALMVTAFSSCSDENTSGGSPTAGSNYNYSVSMSVFYNLAANFDIFLEWLGGHVYHNGCESTVNAALAQLE